MSNYADELAHSEWLSARYDVDYDDADYDYSEVREPAEPLVCTCPEFCEIHPPF